MEKKIPMRQRLGCREMRPKRELMRVVRSPEGEIGLDFRGKAPGRGAYVCRDVQCLKKAIKARALERALSVQIPPEIYDGTVEIKSIAREAGSRTKMAVWSADPDVDPIGSCVGPKGGRVASIVNELGGEKIDIVKYSEVPEEYIAAALSPSEVVSVTMMEDGKSCRVIVPDSQLSLAIGKEGQNARLAAKLTGYKIDIKPESEA